MSVLFWFVLGVTIMVLGDAVSDYISACANRIEVSVEERRAKLESEKKQSEQVNGENNE